jgi:hypothetical protein
MIQAVNLPKRKTWKAQNKLYPGSKIAYFVEGPLELSCRPHTGSDGALIIRPVSL